MNIKESNHHFWMNIIDELMTFKKIISQPKLNEEKIAEFIGIDEMDVALSIRLNYGLSVYDYIQIKKAHYAVNLISNKPSRSHDFIARECGYKDALHFSECCSQYLIETPINYIDKVKES